MEKSNIDLIKEQKTLNQIQSIDDQLYFFDIWFYNQIEGQDPFQLPYLLIDSISIEESLMDWNTKGWIIINNDFELLEKFLPDTQKAPLIFRTDGRNKMRLQLYPILQTTQNPFSLDGPEVSDEIREKWEICLDCVIYDVEDLPVANSRDKKRKLYFHDERYQLFSEKYLDWSTAIEGRKEQNLSAAHIGSPDSERVCRANYALKSIIREAGKDASNNNRQIKIGGGTIDNPKFDVTPDPSTDIGWDNGTEDNNIFYTSPALSNVNDDIKYLLDFCGTKESGPCFLDLTRWENPKNGKYFHLFSLKDYFNEVKNNEQVEHLIVEDGISPDDPSNNEKPYYPKAPNTESNQIKNFLSGRASIIKSYQFSPMVSSDDSRICTTPLHQFDFKTGKFKIQFSNNKIENVYNNLTEYAKDTLYSFNNEDAHILLNINRNKKSGIMINNHFEPLQFVPSHLPQTNMIRDSLILNECISFLVSGLTIRAPGRFVFIDKLSSNADPNPFDDRFLGQWMIIKVIHLFSQGKYYSQVTATKIDAFRKLWDKEDTK